MVNKDTASPELPRLETNSSGRVFNISGRRSARPLDDPLPRDNVESAPPKNEGQYQHIFPETSWRTDTRSVTIKKNWWQNAYHWCEVLYQTKI